MTQNIPSIFIEKRDIDAVVESFKRQVVVSLSAASTAISKQKELRRNCAIALAIHKVDPLGPGSPTAMAA